jgi:hypothetical protein
MIHAWPGLLHAESDMIHAFRIFRMCGESWLGKNISGNKLSITEKVRSKCMLSGYGVLRLYLE